MQIMTDDQGLNLKFLQVGMEFWGKVWVAGNE